LSNMPAISLNAADQGRLLTLARRTGSRRSIKSIFTSGLAFPTRRRVVSLPLDIRSALTSCGANNAGNPPVTTCTLSDGVLRKLGAKPPKIIFHCNSCLNPEGRLVGDSNDERSKSRWGRQCDFTSLTFPVRVYLALYCDCEPLVPITTTKRREIGLVRSEKINLLTLSDEKRQCCIGGEAAQTCRVPLRAARRLAFDTALACFFPDLTQRKLAASGTGLICRMSRDKLWNGETNASHFWTNGFLASVRSRCLRNRQAAGLRELYLVERCSEHFYGRLGCPVAAKQPVILLGIRGLLCVFELEPIDPFH